MALVLLPGKIPWTEEPGRLQSMGVAESDMTRHASTPNGKWKMLKSSKN